MIFKLLACPQKWQHSGPNQINLWPKQHFAYGFQPNWSTSFPQNLFTSLKHGQRVKVPGGTGHTRR